MYLIISINMWYSFLLLHLILWPNLYAIFGQGPSNFYFGTYIVNCFQWFGVWKWTVAALYVLFTKSTECPRSLVDLYIVSILWKLVHDFPDIQYYCTIDYLVLLLLHEEAFLWIPDLNRGGFCCQLSSAVHNGCQLI